ncbi:hypothetical protein NJI34_44710 [Pseudomonas sp. S 311-6]|uniref:hypothetical protein n=1 Tax=Pseudomonas TaxID=286 RepID=UPI001CE457E4|nr:MULTISPECIES: hypothetical protein [Pseudomonas]MCO7643854.1 hypothetical protein [Pseudomonas sp. S 311-6]MCO7568276.1 hypothetical protein [Pseudomonas mosselii]MCO7594767.1 hypothetical protein [Pseudomonas guariconensis]MCO7619962.1 hypothetical protein [Pseudomonas guariconensis]MCO7634872.1 hypothetical protein [Pseudomonas guariconensis]
MRFEEGTLLVIEVKTTLGKSKTPGFLPTQAKGGAINLERIQQLLEHKQQGWDEAILKNTDPVFEAKIQAIDESIETGKAFFLHAQVFFDTKGHPRVLMGNTPGIQLNIWN